MFCFGVKLGVSDVNRADLLCMREEYLGAALDLRGSGDRRLEELRNKKLNDRRFHKMY
jgi:hypothetical protein